MDSITHTLFGLTIYKAMDKQEMNIKERRALLFTAVVGSHLPDSDVVSKFFDSEGLYQMWHRGITHSIFMLPFMAIALFALTALIFNVRDKRIFYVSLFSVFVHITSDLFNAWGTGYLEPFSSIRITFGTIPIIDFVIWGLISSGFILSKLKKQWKSSFIFKMVLLAITAHIVIQSGQGYILYQQSKNYYEQIALSASFLPGHFQIIGKKGELVEISDASLLSGRKVKASLISKENADLNTLFTKNPKAKTLYAWSPFVVVVDNDEQLGIYDPRFYRNGQSFLFEYIDKNDIK